MLKIIFLIVIVVAWVVFWYRGFDLLKSTWFNRVISDFNLGLAVVIVSIVLGISLPPQLPGSFWSKLSRILILTWGYMLALKIGTNS